MLAGSANRSNRRSVESLRVIVLSKSHMTKGRNARHFPASRRLGVPVGAPDKSLIGSIGKDLPRSYGPSQGKPSTRLLFIGNRKLFQQLHGSVLVIGLDLNMDVIKFQVFWMDAIMGFQGDRHFVTVIRMYRLGRDISAAHGFQDLGFLQQKELVFLDHCGGQVWGAEQLLLGNPQTFRQSHEKECMGRRLSSHHILTPLGDEKWDQSTLSFEIF